MAEYAQRLRGEDQPRKRDRVAADVVDRPAADVRLVADVSRIGVEIGEEHLHDAQRPHLPLAHQIAGALPLRVEAYHERFHDVHPVRGRPQPFGICGGQRDRLLAQHVLAGLGRFQGERDVQVVRERVVDGLDLRIGKQLLIAAVGLGDVQPAAAARRPRAASARRWP